MMTISLGIRTGQKVGYSGRPHVSESGHHFQQISAPHLSYRHTDKPTPSKRKQARTASHTGALSNLRKHGLRENSGQLPGGTRCAT